MESEATFPLTACMYLHSAVLNRGKKWLHPLAHMPQYRTIDEFRCMQMGIYTIGAQINGRNSRLPSFSHLAPIGRNSIACMCITSCPLGISSPRHGHVHARGGIDDVNKTIEKPMLVMVAIKHCTSRRHLFTSAKFYFLPFQLLPITVRWRNN